MKQNESLKTKVWLYLTIFSIVILLFLWVFQILFLNSFYEKSKTKDLNNTINSIKEKYSDSYFLSNIDDISRDNGVCIEIVGQDVEYNSISFNKGCIPSNSFDEYKNSFIESNLETGSIKLINTKFKNEVLIRAVKLDSNIFAFASVSIEPLDSTIYILKNQFLTVSIVVLILSFLIGYFISKRISIPIEKINSNVKEISKGNYKVKFESNENIKEISELVKNLNDATSELDKTENLRNELLANVSHDLKTPLTMIKAYAEMVRDITYKNKEKREENLNVIIDETDRLNTLVNDIIELSKVQSKVIKLNKEDFDLVNLINSIIKKFEYLEYNINLNTCSNEIVINADKIRMEQILYNLISNAIKFTGKDKKVDIKLENINDNIKVSISDTGKGIETEDLPYIWERYYKSDKSYKRSTNGSGLGLSIVKNLFILNNFEYNVESTKNKGTTFWFIIHK